MISLFTGLPGNGKTLYAISHVKEWSEKDSRPVFYSGIELNEELLPWTKIEAEDWHKCPTGSIVVIDECQRVFRPRTISKEIPEYVSKLETHRHLGIDLVLITQHPLLADSSIRRLTGDHRHIIRIWGTANATIHQWGSVKDSCDKTSGRLDSNKTKWRFDKKVYDYYKSAELHTGKTSVPFRIYLVIAAPIAIAFGVWYMYGYTQKQSNPTTELASLNGIAPGASQATVLSYKNGMEEAKQYIYLSTPRFQDLPHTAPKYDELTKPTIAPTPVGCVETKNTCRCFSQQGTPINVSANMCLNIVQNGFFQDFDVNGQQQKDSNQQNNQVSKNDLL
ncbi:zonular occludens toxin domain-containing protein [Solimicrobium silvestre]|uniref:Zonular occludens toxin (Zot) n=1 Tax=Solimicrobium silvestre TaxID=2099400 RepID=A0A2S9GTI0_9BURK|nr:zonular occludens toxin domain-containing protein [Solimicrobium silvestre]PRC91032.1 Zonular occludens toxin (Zot) [Solimicrobium silvestre]